MFFVLDKRVFYENRIRSQSLAIYFWNISIFKIYLVRLYYWNILYNI